MLNYIKPHLLKFAVFKVPKDGSMDNPSQFQGIVKFNLSTVYWTRIATIWGYGTC